MVQIRQSLSMDLMREGDIATVQEIERDIFATPWPRNAYYRELASRSSAHYVVLRQEGVEAPPRFHTNEMDASIVGYGGMWRMYDQAHLTTLRLRPGPPPPRYRPVPFPGSIKAPDAHGRNGATTPA